MASAEMEDSPTEDNSSLRIMIGMICHAISTQNNARLKTMIDRLCQAIRESDLETMKSILEEIDLNAMLQLYEREANWHGPGINFNVDQRQEHPISVAIKQGNIRALNLLLSYEQMNVECVFWAVTSADNVFSRVTPIQYASYIGSPSMTEHLLKVGAKCNVDNETIEQPLMALLLGFKDGGDHLKALDILLSNGADVNRMRPIHRGWFNISLFTALKIPSALIKLLRCGSDPAFIFKRRFSDSMLKPTFNHYENKPPEQIFTIFKMLILFCAPGPDFVEFSTFETTLSGERAMPPHLIQELQVLLTNPKSLKSLCRLTCRKTLYSVYKNALEAKIPSLPIPEPMKTYLLFPELDDTLKVFDSRKRKNTSE